LPRETIANLRHDLRTPINHILGYSEMLIEEATDDGCAALAAACAQIRDAGKKVLDRIGEALAPSREQISDSELRRLAERLQPDVTSLGGLISSLIQQTSAAGRKSYLVDLHKLQSAVQHLSRMSTELLGGPASASQSSAAAPVQVSESKAHPPRSSPGAIPKAWGRLLVVDDNEANRDMLGRRLEREGYSYAVAENGRQALEMIRGKGFDLVLLDIMMPEVDGYQVLSEVKAAPETRDIPIIMISALDEIQSVVRCIEMGAEDYLPKPFDPVLLRARVGACLEKKRLRDQELEYLRNVSIVTKAAAAVKAGTFEPSSMSAVAGRTDELGELARVFQQMGQEVQAREQRLRQEVQQLRVEIDQARRAHHVAEITETDYFLHLQERAQELRRRSRKPSE
jgi:DNA-binding response OmpR family regulator